MILIMVILLRVSQCDDLLAVIIRNVSSHLLSACDPIIITIIIMIYEKVSPIYFYQFPCQNLHDGKNMQCASWATAQHASPETPW